MTLVQINFTRALGPYEKEYTMFFDSDVMTEEEALKECHFADGGCYNIKNLGHFLIVDEKELEFLKALVRSEKDKAREEGFEAGQNNMLEAGYHID